VWARVDLVTTRTCTRRTRRPVTRGGKHTRALPYLPSVMSQAIVAKDGVMGMPRQQTARGI